MKIPQQQTPTTGLQQAKKDKNGMWPFMAHIRKFAYFAKAKREKAKAEGQPAELTSDERTAEILSGMMSENAKQYGFGIRDIPADPIYTRHWQRRARESARKYKRQKPQTIYITYGGEKYCIFRENNVCLSLTTGTLFPVEFLNT